MNTLIDVVRRVALQSHDGPPGALIGVVTEVDDQRRVKLRLPTQDNVVTDWAPIALPMAGNGRAVSFTPRAEDQAIVVFLNGDWRQPIAIGFLSSKKDPLPPEFSNGQCGLILGANQPRVALNETKNDGGPGVVITDGQGNRITIRTEGNTIEITAAGSISLSAPQGQVSISAKTIELTSTEKTTVNAPTMEVTADHALNLHGNPININ